MRLKQPISSEGTASISAADGIARRTFFAPLSIFMKASLARLYSNVNNLSQERYQI